MSDLIIPFFIASGVTFWVCVFFYACAKAGLWLGNVIGSVLVKRHYKNNPLPDFIDERIPF